MKDQIVGTALNLFLSKGVLQTSLIDIAKTLNLTKGAIYHYFRNKDELLYASFDMILMGMGAYLEPIKVETVSLEDALYSLQEIMLANSTDDASGQYEFLLYCSRNYPELKEKLIAATEEFKHVFYSKIIEEQNNGRIEGVDIDYILLKISLVFEGTMYLNQVYAPIDMKTYLPRLFKEIINDLYE